MEDFRCQERCDRSIVRGGGSKVLQDPRIFYAVTANQVSGNVCAQAPGPALCLLAYKGSESLDLTSVYWGYCCGRLRRGLAKLLEHQIDHLLGDMPGFSELHTGDRDQTFQTGLHAVIMDPMSLRELHITCPVTDRGQQSTVCETDILALEVSDRVGGIDLVEKCLYLRLTHTKVVRVGIVGQVGGPYEGAAVPWGNEEQARTLVENGIPVVKATLTVDANGIPGYELTLDKYIECL
jgi:hypothetical protein